jgi:hypothetical protein
MKNILVNRKSTAMINASFSVLPETLILEHQIEPSFFSSKPETPKPDGSNR